MGARAFRPEDFDTHPNRTACRGCPIHEQRTKDSMGHIKVSEPNGAEHVLDAIEGWRVMELIRIHGLPIEAQCGGACACATCHVHVAPEWAGRLHPARDDEEAMLDTLPSTAATSRLSCQIVWDTHLDGLELALAAPQDP